MNPSPHIIIQASIEDHVYDGDGKCRCGKAVGHSDGVMWSVYMEEHQAAEAVAALDRMGYQIVEVDR